MTPDPNASPGSISNEPEASPHAPPARTHPEERPRRRGARRWAIWVAVLCLLFGGGYMLSQRSSPQQASGGGGSKGKGKRGAGGPIPVSAATVQKGNMGEYIEALGTVTSVYTVTVTSRVAGELTEIHYKEGQIVHKGQLLAVIDPRPYVATYVQAQGQLQRDQATLENARIDLKRYQMAFEQHAVPEQQVATQLATVHQDEGTVKLDEGNLDAAKVNVDYAQITSPIDGRVGLRTTDLGNIVAANGTTGLATITQLAPITVIFNMAEDFVDQVFNQMRTGKQLRVDALNRDNETELAQGTLLTIDSQIDTTTGTVRARATFANKDYRLFPNEFVNAKLLVKTLMGVNIVPMAAIQRNNDLAYVYVINANKTVQQQNVTIATSDGMNAAVTGVAPGQTVVTDGFDKLLNGSKVVIRTPSGKVSQTPQEQAAQNHRQTNTAQQASKQAAQSGQTPQATQGQANEQLNTSQQNPQNPQKGTSK